MKQEKAYKLLAIQEGISNRQAKEIIDRGLVHARGKKIILARGMLDCDVAFKIQEIERIKIIHEDKNVLVVNKPAFITSEEIAKTYNFELLHRLDQETSGVLILCKNEEFKEKAINAFRNKEVEKIYYAIIEGKFVDSLVINTPIQTLKINGKAISKISKDGKEAVTEVDPMMIIGNLSFLKIKIPTGRTHQIRVHLKSSMKPVLGDQKYGGKPAKRLMLHAYKVKIFNYEFVAKLPKDFKDLGFSA